MEKEKKDLQTKDCSLSIDNWVTVLSSEINWNRELFYHERNTSMILGTSLIAFVAGFFAILLQDIKLAYFTILIAILIAIYLVYSIRECWRALKRTNVLERIRGDAIFRRRDLKEICKRRKEYKKGIF